MARLFGFIIGLLLFASAQTAHAKRVALIIGNSDYQSSSSLANPANDAKIIADAAQLADFDNVTIATDLSNSKFQLALRDFRKQAIGADVAMVYFAGHGIESQGKNWLIPVDAELKSSLDLPYEAINLDRVMESLSGAQIRMVVLDACRNNPFARSWKSGTRSLTRGLAGVEADDVLVIYAAAPGQTAMDGEDQNSPFAKSFARRIPQAGLPVQLLGGMVRDDVLAATGGMQRPFISASITGTPVYLVDAASGAESSNAPETSAIAVLDEAALDALAWQGAVNANTPSAYRSYLDEFPGGKFAGLAIENTKSENAAPDSVPKPEKTGGLINAFLPNRYEVEQGEALPIDGIWTISTIKKRIRIEKGRAYAIDGWTHALILKVLPEMVVLQNIKRTAAGQYEGYDLPLTARAEMSLRSDGNINISAKTFPFPIKYTLIQETLDSAGEMETEQQAIASRK
ncbi:caspase family protein [Parasphingorhabdus sp.]|uniref:caspase family protein n=1 Tax=Parasphingorhabdus sp. TaxID=2709688 RepID=UPI003299C41C